MFEISALPLQTSAQPLAAIVANPAPAPLATPEIPGLVEDANGPQDAPSFEALLALQATPPLPSSAPAATLAPTALQEGGKILPEAAKPVAASDERANEPDVQAGQDAGPETATASALPDPALIAAIFAAPDRLAPTPARAERERSPAAPAVAARTSAAPVSPQPAPSLAVTASAIAATAQIELQPDAAPAPATEEPVAQAATQQASAPIARQLAERTRNRAAAPDAAAPESAALPRPEKEPALADTQMPESEPQAVAISDQRAELLRSLPAQPANSEGRPERIDFATLVDTLARAREEASPHRITVSVGHADFGRVALRFDQDESRGMQVAMSSADPGFARAVTATMEATQGSSSTAGQSAGSQPSQHQGEPSRQHQQPERSQSRVHWNGTPATSSETPASEPARDARGIYA